MFIRRRDNKDNRVCQYLPILETMSATGYKRFSVETFRKQTDSAVDKDGQLSNTKYWGTYYSQWTLFLFIKSAQQKRRLYAIVLLFVRLFVCRLKRILVGHWFAWPSNAGSASMHCWARQSCKPFVSGRSAAARHTDGGRGLSHRPFRPN